jgi:aspartate racemase
MRTKTIGILGGMGPEATAYFFGLIVGQTQAARDQDHIPIIICSNPKIPERTAAVLGLGPSPVPLLKDGVRRLARAGADFIVIPCITAHAFLPEMKAASPLPILNILNLTRAFSVNTIPGLARVGLIASTGTARSGLFARTFSKAGIAVITPTDKEQKKVMEAIFGERGIKAGFTSGRARKLILEAARGLIGRGAQAIIAGCTEVPLVLRQKDLRVPLIEPLQIAAEAAIIRAGYPVKSLTLNRAFRYKSPC